MKGVVRVALSLLFLCSLSSSIFHQDKIHRDKRTGEEVLVYINHATPENRRLLLDFNINKVRSSTEVEAYIKEPAQLELLERQNFEYKIIPNSDSRSLRQYNLKKRIVNLKRSLDSDILSDQDENGCGIIDPTKEFADYHSYDQLTTFLKNIHCLYPSITRLFSIGKSVAGRDLWVLEISKNPGVNELEPKFKYVGNMHGDETVGREILLRFIHNICSQYGQSQKISWLIDHTDIFVLPTMNPDGFEAGTRANANDFDLNRNFPDQYKGFDEKIAQPEVLALMNWLNNNTFVLSANFHGGDVVANYPFDGNLDQASGLPSPAPDNVFFKFLARIYADHNPTMSKSKDFPKGITNGAQWYILYGGMQDFNYLWHGCMEITVELSSVKFPPASQLDDYWNQNKLSLLRYLQAVHIGAKGTVKDGNGKPLRAEINVAGINHTIHSDPVNGGYYRLLLPGREYTLTATVEGRSPISKTLTVPRRKKNQLPVVVYDFVFK